MQSPKVPNPRLFLYFAPCVGVGLVVVCRYLRWEAKVAGEAGPLGLESGLTDRSLSDFAADLATSVELGEHETSRTDRP